MLTAYYMSRLIFMTFFGEARWDEGHEGHAVHPHESPAIMTVPLVVLAVFSTVIGIIDLPFGSLDFLEQLHEPLFGDIVREVSLSGAAEVGLIIIATVLAFLGIFAAYQAWVLRKVEADRLEPEVLQRGWYLNDAYAAFFGGPATVGAEFTSDVVDHEVIDGAVNGVGVLVRSGAGQLRKLQIGLRPQLRARHRCRRGAAARMVLLPGERLMDFPILTALVLTPAISAVIVALLPTRRLDVVRVFGLAAAVLTGALSIALLVAFDRESGGFQFVSFHEWIPSFGISWHLGVDGISLFLVVLTGVLFPIALFGVDAHGNEKAYMAWMLLLEAGCIGTFLSLDLFLFFICFEIVLVPMYFIIGQWGHGERVYAATKFFLFTMLGSAFMLVGIISTAVLHQRGAGGAFTFDVVAIAENPAISQSAARWLFVAFRDRVRGEGAVVPRAHVAARRPHQRAHGWLGDPGCRHAEARHLRVHPVRPLPLPRSDGVLRAGAHNPRRHRHHVRGDRGHDAARPQTARRVLVGRAPRVHHPGHVRPHHAEPHGWRAQMINHGISTGALFLLVGMIYERRHTREIAQLNGLQKAAPFMAAFFTLVMLSSIGVPGLNGFVGEFLILIGSFLARAGGRSWPRRVSSSLRSTCCGRTNACSTVSLTKRTPR